MIPTSSLSLYEIELASFVGRARYQSAVQKGSKDRNGPKHRDPQTQHIHSTGAEIAFAKWANLYWAGHVDTYKGLPDVGDKYEIRWCETLRPPMLHVYPNDPELRVYVLMDGEFPHFRIHGWIWGWEAQLHHAGCYQLRPGYRAAYHIPVQDLHDPHLLKTVPTFLPGDTITWPESSSQEVESSQLVPICTSS